MKVIDLANALRNKGYAVSVYKRPDGGYRITSINGMTFKTSDNRGNEAARSLVGQGGLSNVQKAQRFEAARFARVAHKATIGLPKMTKREKSKLAKMNKLAKKLKAPHVSATQFRQAKKRNKRGAAAFKTMKNTLLKFMDVAMVGSVYWFLGLLEEEADLFPKTIAYLNKYRYSQSDTALMSCHDIYYSCQASGFDPAQCAQADSDMAELLKEGHSQVMQNYKDFKAPIL